MIFSAINIAIIIGVFVGCIIAWLKWQANRAKQQVKKLEAENQQQSITIKTQEKVIKNAKVKQKNNDHTRRSNASSVDEQLQQHDWFRG